MNDSHHWEKLQELFHLAERTAQDDRARVLAAAGADDDLRCRALEILAASETEAAAAPELHPGKHWVGRAVGQYRLVRQIGSGGIGTVYLAERVAGGILQRSALKVLAPHAAGRHFVERFQREQHVLSSLDHPHITRMLDAGIDEDGQSYLVMEFVDGIPMDAYCDLHRYTIDQRLRLFLQICDALAYAHRNLVVHLDLKPSNTLVTADANVKLLDFGTSKFIDLNGRFTATLMATPAYASPEQMRGEPVTTLCDVYSLGAILFELLAGRRPGGASSVIAMMDRAARELEPERLEEAVTEDAAATRGSTVQRLRQALRGDLATIVGKCLRPRARDRYISVNALASDVQRFLEGKPVLARRQTTRYRLGKFVRRHLLQVVAAAIAVLALALTAGYAAWRQRQANEQGQRALRMQIFMSSLFKLANETHTGKPAATLPEFLQLGITVLPQYIHDPHDLLQAQLSLAESMTDSGDDVHSLPAFQAIVESARAHDDLGAEAEAEAFAGNIDSHDGRIEDSLRITQHAFDLSRTKGISPTVRFWAELYHADAIEYSGKRIDSNLVEERDAIRISRESRLPPQLTATALMHLGEILVNRGDLKAADPMLRDALGLFQREPFSTCNQSEVYDFLSLSQHMAGDDLKSLELNQKAYDGYVACAGPDSREALSDQAHIAARLIYLGRPHEAVVMLQSTLPKWRALVGETPEVAEMLYYAARANVEDGRWTEAEALASEAVKVQTGHIAPGGRRFGMPEYIWARALFGQRRFSEALPHARNAASMLDNQTSPSAAKDAAQARDLYMQVQANLSPKN